jgi:outer membrane protein
MKTIMLAMALVLGAGFAQAQNKVGYVDVQKAIQATAAGKKAKEVLDGEYGKRKKDLDKKKADIEKMNQDLEKKKTVLSEEVMGKKQMELQEEMMKFQKTVAENQLEIQKKEKELVEPILEKMRRVIEKVAQEKGYTLVIEKQSQNVLYAQKDADLTDSVIQAYEKEK